MTKTELKAKVRELLDGEVTFTKVDFCLIGLSCLMAGICIGLLTAPYTHGITIGSNNGNTNNNNYDGSAADEEQEGKDGIES